MPLKYLFTVLYKDGRKYEQNAEDRSITEPETRSCFYDIKQDDVAAFFLTGNGHQYAVSLIDGHFEIDGAQFAMHEEELSGFRLIFFRKHTHSFNQGTGRELSHEVVYRMGWQCTIEGKNYQRVMMIH